MSESNTIFSSLIRLRPLSVVMLLFGDVCVDGIDAEGDGLNVTPGGHRGDLDERVERNLHVGQLLQWLVHEVAQYAAQYSL